MSNGEGLANATVSLLALGITTAVAGKVLKDTQHIYFKPRKKKSKIDYFDF